MHLLLPNYEKFRKGSLRLEIVPENDVKTATVPLDGLAGSFVPPPESFKFRLSGKTNTGTSFQVTFNDTFKLNIITILCTQITLYQNIPNISSIFYFIRILYVYTGLSC